MQRQPRIKNDAHCGFIRELPCLVCGDATSTECAHVRFACLSVGKRQCGIAEKPDDKFTVPLCNRHHTAQHDYGDEQDWWNGHNIDPIRVALALYSVTGEYERGLQIVTANFVAA